MQDYVSCALLAVAALTPSLNADSWPQWGGPNRDFKSTATGLAESWPPSGPKQLWKRELGEGHSAIVSDDERLFTQYSRGEQEFALAISADTGQTLWEHRYDAPTTGMDYSEGKGPHATPLI